MTQESAQPAGTAPASTQSTHISLGMVLLIVLVALGPRVGYVLVASRELQFPDERQYLNIAQNFVKGEGLTVSIDSQTANPLHFPQEIQRPPLYPLILALMDRAKAGLTGVRLMQALLGALTCVIIYLLAAELVEEWPARIAGLIAAVYPFYVYFTGRILSETLFLLFFVTSIYYIVRMWKDVSGEGETVRWLASCMMAGLLGAAAVLTRSSALPVYLLVPLVWLVIGPRRSEGLAAGVLMLIVLGIGMSPWIARNFKRSGDQETGGRLVVTTLKVGESLYEAVGPFATGGPNKENTLWPPEAEARIADEYMRNQYLVERSLAYMRNNPGRTLRLAVVKFLRTWNVIPNYRAVRKPFYIVVSLVSYVPVLLSALLGLYLRVRHWRSVVWLLLPVVVITLIHMVFVGSVRYRLAMMPFVTVFSGVGVWWLISKVFKVGSPTVEDRV